MSTPPDVLIVEDDPAAGYALVSLLTIKGYRVEAAGTAADALRLAARGPRCVVLDLMLPDGPGDAIIPELLAASPGCKVVVWTGRPMTDRLADDLAARGAHAVVAKPISLDALIAELPPPGRPRP